MPEDCEKSDRLVICTDDEENWRAFLQLCCKSFQNSAPFKRSHPDFAKRKKIVKAYFAYLYETELSGGRAGLACVKRRTDSEKEEIVYGLVGIYNGSAVCAGDKSDMMSIDPVGADITIREDEWIRENFRDKITEASHKIGFVWIYYALQASKYPNHGLATKYFRKAGELIYHDGVRQQKMPRGVPGVGYTVLDDYTVKDFYTKVGMIELAHRHIKGDCEKTCKQELSSDNRADREYDCVYLMYEGYPQRDCFEEPLKRFFRSTENCTYHHGRSPN